MAHKILFLIPSMNGGGAEKVTMLLGNELIKLGWDVSFAMSKIEGPYLEQLDKNIGIINLPYRKISRNILAIRRVLHNERPDIFYTSMEYVNIIGGIAHKLSDKSSKLVFSEHNNIERTLERITPLMKSIYKTAIRFIYPMSDHIVCVSKGVKFALLKQFPLELNISVIYNPIEQMKPIISSGSTRLPFKILSIGRLNKQKNHILLLQAFKYMLDSYPIDARLTIIGEGEERINLEKYVIDNGLSEKVHLPGFQDPNKYLNNSDLFVLSSEYEGFGNVLVEALSTGIQVISTDCPSGPSEILEQGQIGYLVENNNVEELSATIYKAYNEEEDEIAKINRIRRASDFSPEKIINEYQDLFHRLLDNK